MRSASGRAATVLEHALREGDDEHLALRVAENVIDRGREETRLATPARRRPEHDQIDLPLGRLFDDRVPDRARSDRLRLDGDVVVLTQVPRLLERQVRSLGDLLRQRALEGELAR